MFSKTTGFRKTPGPVQLVGLTAYQWGSYGGLGGRGPSQSPEKKFGNYKNENLPSASLHRLENST